MDALSTSEAISSNFTTSSDWAERCLTTSSEGSESVSLHLVASKFPEGSVINIGASLHEYCGKLLEVSESAQLSHVIGLPSIGTVPINLKIEEAFRCEQETNSQKKADGAEVLTELLVSEIPHVIVPEWALRMNDCEAIGDSFRGWVRSEAELELLLSYHRQQTKSCWGTRQSTGSHRSSLRLMWKSQYIPFDGVPFINSGSRAVVMECCYGPRRKGNTLKRLAEGSKKGEFKPTCPARIYIKKVHKYPEYEVDRTLTKRALKTAMEKAFLELKVVGLDVQGEDRWYAQLPLESAHEFHEKPEAKLCKSAEKNEPNKGLDLSPKRQSRLDLNLIDRIRELVSLGETNVFVIRKQLRKYVEQELFDSQLPDRHNLSFFPTVHDIQNNVYEALKDIRSGALPLLAPSLNFEVLNPKEKLKPLELEGNENLDKNLSNLQTITITLSRSNDPGQVPILSKVETQLRDGSFQVSSTITPETFDLLSQLHPSVFPHPSIIQESDALTETSTASELVPYSVKQSVQDQQCLRPTATSDVTKVPEFIIP